MNKKKIWLLLGYALVLLIGGYILWQNSISNSISAHPTDTIILNQDDEHSKFVVPTDATKLWEPALTSNNIYKDYVQNTESKVSFSKNGFYTVSSTTESEYYVDVARLADGGYVVLGEETTYYLGHPGKYNSHGFVTLLDEQGKEQKGMRTYLDPNPKHDGTPFSRRPLSYHGLIKTGENYQAFYRNDSDGYKIYTVAISYDAGAKKFIVSDQKKMDITSVDDTFRGYTSLTRDIEGNMFLNESQSYAQLGKEPNPESIFLYQVEPEGTVFPKTTLEKPNIVELAPPNWGKKASTDNWSVREFSKTKFGYVARLNITASTGAIVYEYFVIWDVNGKLTYVSTRSENEGSTAIQFDTSTDTEVYFTKSADTDLSLLKVTNNSSVEEFVVFPKDSKLKFVKSDSSNKPNDISFYGEVENFTGIFDKLGEGKSVVLGSLDTKKLSNFSTIKIDVPLFHEKLFSDGDSLLLVGGHTGTSDITTLLSPNYQVKERPEFQNALSVSIKKEEDYSPIIKKLEPKAIDTEQEINVLEQELLSDLNVYDTYDLSEQNLSGQKSEKWLSNRVNRNPNTIKYGPDGENLSTLPEDSAGNMIDWKTLGFDKNNTGPQLVTYFLSDSQKQATSTSRWINAKDDKTQETDNYFLKANNFSISITEIPNLDQSNFRKFASTKAWNGTSGVIEEDALHGSLSSKVAFKTFSQFDAIKNTSTTGAFPVDLVYKATATVNVVNRIWVYVTDENTVVDETNDVVIYKKPYTLPLYKAKDETVRSVLDNAKVKVYKYQATEQTGEEPLLLASGDKDFPVNITKLSILPNDLALLNQTTKTSESPVSVNFAYTTVQNQQSQATASVTLESYKSTVTAQFENENKDLLEGYTVKTKEVIVNDLNQSKDLTKEKIITDQLEAIKTAGYDIIARPSDEKAVLLTSPDVTVKYAIEGLLSITSAPKEFDFGQVYYNAQTQRVEMPIFDSDLSLQDTRATRDNGWVLSAKLSTPMQNMSGEELTDALRYRKEKDKDGKADEVILTKDVQEIYANQDAKTTPNITISDSWRKGGPGLKFQLDGDLKPKLGDYKGTITWLITPGMP